MKKLVIIIVTSLMLTACASSQSSTSLTMEQEFKDTQRVVNNCLAEQLVKLIETSPTPEMAIKVSATRCEYTAYIEGERLKRLFVNKTQGQAFAELMIGMDIPNSNRSVTEGFVNRLTSKSDLESTAEHILLSILQEIEKM